MRGSVDARDIPSYVQDIHRDAMMGALYVKDHEAFAMAQELAEKRGLTKVAAVKLALANELARDEPKPSLHDVIAELRRTSTLTFNSDIVNDKAFYDSLYEDDDE